MNNSVCLLFFERHFVASSKQVVELTLCIAQKIHGLVMIATIELKNIVWRCEIPSGLTCCMIKSTELPGELLNFSENILFCAIEVKF